MGFLDTLFNPSIEQMEFDGNVTGLIRALRHRKDWQERKAAAKALLKMRDARAVEPLIHALRDENNKVREISAVVLGAMVILGILDTLAESPLVFQMKRTHGMVSFDKTEYSRSLALLIQALKDGDEHVRLGAATALGIIGDKEMVVPLTQTLTDDYEVVREEITKALGRISRIQDAELSEQEKERIAELGAKLSILPSREAFSVLADLVKMGVDTSLLSD